MSYNFNKSFVYGKFDVKVDEKAKYGYFEHHEYGEDCGGGLWFERTASGKLELMDYDGVFELPRSVRNCLRENGFVVDDVF